MVMRWIDPREDPNDPLEKRIQDGITGVYRDLGCLVSSTSQRRPSQQAIGMPDLWVMRKGWALYGEPGRAFGFWLEVKRPPRRPRDPDRQLSWDQQQWHQYARETGWECWTTDSPAEALALLVHLGAPVVLSGQTRPFDVDAQQRFWREDAEPRPYVRRPRAPRFVRR